MGLGFRASGTGAIVKGSRFKGSENRVKGKCFRFGGVCSRLGDSGFRVQGSEFRVQGSGFRAWDIRSWVLSPGFRIRGRPEHATD